MMRTSILVLSLLLASACGGGGGSPAAPSQPLAAGVVQLVLDTATGSPTLVQVQIAAAVLETTDGAMTANVLPAPRTLALADPTAAVDGLTLGPVPAGAYDRLHLAPVPGSGVARFQDGTSVAMDLPADLVISFSESVDHDGQRNTWVHCGHNGSAPPAAAAGPFAWSPEIGGRAQGAEVTLTDANITFVGPASLSVELARLPGTPLGLTFAPDCTFLDEGGNEVGRAAFLAPARLGNRVTVAGNLDMTGYLLVRQIRHRGQGQVGPWPRLIGRITSVDPVVETFVMDVFAEARRGGPALLPLPSEAEVSTIGAELQRPNGSALEFADLAVHQLVKVSWLWQSLPTSGRVSVTADEIEVSPAGGAAMDPQWVGSVQSVDLVLRTLTIVPRSDPIIIRGLAQDPVTLHVDESVEIERHEPGRYGRSTIALEEVVGGQDRIWFRGRVTGPAAIEASWLRVRDDT